MAWSLIRRTVISPIWEIGQNSAPGSSPRIFEPLPHGFGRSVVDVGVALFVALAPDDECTGLRVVIGHVQRDHLGPAKASSVKDPDEGGIPEVGWAATPARLKQCPQLPTGECSAPGQTLTPDCRKVDGPLEVLGAHQPEPPCLPEDASQSGQVPICRCRAVSLSEGGTKGAGCAGSPNGAKAAPRSRCGHS